MTVGIFGGSFNPVHNGHIALAHVIIDHGIADEVWLTLSPLNPLKSGSTELLDDQIRLQMLQLATEGIPGLRVCDIELSLPKPSYTINTLLTLSHMHPGIQFRLVIGSDNMLIFNRWKSNEEIKRMFPPIVYPRPGYHCPEALDLPVSAISSTLVREKIRNGEAVNNLIPSKVNKYIRENGLYMPAQEKTTDTALI